MFGGLVGAFYGLLPGYGGGSSEWLCYGLAANKHDKRKAGQLPEDEVDFGYGNIKGVIAPEGVNNAGKAGAMVPTLLFGIPGAKFAVILMALWTYVGYDLGEVIILSDTDFINMVALGFLIGTVVTGLLCYILATYLAYICYIPARYYMPFLLLTTWFAVVASNHYSSVLEDTVLLVMIGLLGCLMKKYKFSRPALLLAFVLSEKIEDSTATVLSLYSFDTLITRPIFLSIIGVTIILIIMGLRMKNRITYA